MLRVTQSLLLCVGVAILPGCMRFLRSSTPEGATRPLAATPTGRQVETPPRQVVVIQPTADRPVAPAVAPDSEMHEPIQATVPDALSADRGQLREADLGPSEPPRSINPAVSTAEVKTDEPIRLLKTLKAYLEERPDEALELLKQYPPKDQELLLTLLPIISQVEQKKPTWPTLLDDAQKLAVIQTLRSLLATLEKSAPLVISKLDFAQEVKSFGRYKPLPKAHFRAGDNGTLYMEVENLRDRRAKEGHYVARLSGALLIRGEHSNPGWGLPLQTAEDRSSTDRDDHFAVIHFRVPNDAPPGMYVLFVQLVDQETQRRTERGVTFRVVSTAASE